MAPSMRYITPFKACKNARATIGHYTADTREQEGITNTHLLHTKNPD
jgi:hypothetical protein